MGTAGRFLREGRAEDRHERAPASESWAQQGGSSARDERRTGMSDVELPAAVAIVGCGSIGTAFAVLFARAGFTVRAWDAMPVAFGRAADDLRHRLSLLEVHGLLTESAALVASRVSFHSELADALVGAVLVQECAPEEIALKRTLFAQLAELAPPDAVLASSSSALV